MRPTLLTLLAIFAFNTAAAQAANLTLAVVDTSRPMGERWQGETRLALVSTYLSTLVRGLPGGSHFGLITFGSDRCAPEILVRPQEAGLALVSTEAQLSTLIPRGDRALAAGLESALTLAEESPADHVTLLVFTSGVDQCNADMSELQTRFRARASKVELQVFGLEVEGSLGFDLVEAVGALGGSFEAFGTPAALQEQVVEGQRAASAGLHVLVNVPADEEGEYNTISAQVEVYSSGTQALLFQQAAIGSVAVDLTGGVYDVMARWGGDIRWQRGVRVATGAPTTIQFDFSKGAGNVRIELTDHFGYPIEGAIRIVDEMTEAEVMNQEGAASYGVTLSEGDYLIEVSAGGEIVIEPIRVEEGDTLVVPLSIEAIMGQALLSINNFDSTPLNGDILIYDTSGKLLETFTSTSSIRVNLPEGDYEAIARLGTVEERQTFNVIDGDETLVDFQLDLPTGYLLVKLRDEDGSSVVGSLQIFDQRGSEVPHFELENFLDSEFSVELPEGVYSLRIESDGVVRSVASVSIRAEEETELSVEFAAGTFGEGGGDSGDYIGGDDDGMN